MEESALAQMSFLSEDVRKILTDLSRATMVKECMNAVLALRYFGVKPTLIYTRVKVGFCKASVLSLSICVTVSSSSLFLSLLLLLLGVMPSSSVILWTRPSSRP